MLSERDDIIVIADEAHRTQYDTLALNLRNALPNAAFLAFTGTPLIVGEERTKEVFGDYVTSTTSASIEDGATVPLYYENRIPEMQLTPRSSTSACRRSWKRRTRRGAGAAARARVWPRVPPHHREDRFDAIAEDVVSHFVARGYRGKAMMVSVDKATAVRMFDKVRAHWQTEVERLGALLAMRMETTASH